MRRRRSIAVLFFLVLPLITGMLLVSCGRKQVNGLIIVSETDAKAGLLDLVTGEGWRYLTHSRLVAIDPEKAANSPEVISTGFYSACSPTVSWDGRHMVFAAQVKRDDPWAIYEMDLCSMKSHLVIQTKQNCTDPAYLPEGRIIFSKTSSKDSTGRVHEIFTCLPDGSDLLQLTFHPHADFALTLLPDGRVLAISRQLSPSLGKQMLYVLRPNGTKGDLFYEASPGTELVSRAWEMASGNVFFIERSLPDTTGSIICISQNRPLHSRVNLSEGIKGDFFGIFPRASGSMLALYRTSANERYGLYEFDTHGRKLGRALLTDPAYNLAEVVVAEKVARPKKLPSELNMGVKSGLMMCQDVNLLDPKWMSDPNRKKISRIEVLGLHKSLGTFDVQEDGSFYIKIMADIPFRIQGLDANGKVVVGPCSWLWMRPAERRGCIGCHEDPELVPDNRLPMAVKKAPVIIPSQIMNVKEAEIESD